MSWFVRRVVCTNELATETHVAETVQALVHCELLFEAQTAFVRDGASVDKDCIVESGAAREAGAPQHRQILCKAKCPSSVRSAAHKFRPQERKFLQFHFTGEFNAHGNTKVVHTVVLTRWGEHCPPRAAVRFHSDFANNLNPGLRALCRLKGEEVGESIHKHLRGSVENWNFWTVHLNRDILDAQTGNRCQQMFYRGDSPWRSEPPPEKPSAQSGIMNSCRYVGRKNRAQVCGEHARHFTWNAPLVLHVTKHNSPIHRRRFNGHTA
mmetsp:Transcript_285/g.933  ORF Transcript_285/g.933 Transcript_285/m.933 type:complete len:266 (-) Transcript_285:150-947(-)